MSLRTKTLLLFLTFVLVPLGAVGVVGALGTRTALEQAVERTLDVTPPPADDGAAAGSPAAPTGTVSVDEILAPLDRVVLVYLALMFAIGAAATVAFRYVTRRLFRSLEELSGAVERIADGDLAPWLPPPGQNEVGWLSMALGRMAERIGQTMQSVEQSGRLAMVGEMAAQMAHEIRTPLSSVRMNLQLLERSARRGDVPPDAKLCIDTSLAEIDRLETAVRRMLEFGSPERGLRTHCGLHALIRKAVDLLQSPLEAQNIRLRTELNAESDSIWADAGRVKGVFLNLFVNARDAMPDGGEILVETQLYMGEGGQQMVAVAVSDTGPGVPVSLKEEVFHPFFTTKVEGSGIGLPAALRTLREHGGDLFLSERLDGGPGACFVALFPLALGEMGDEPGRHHVDPIGEMADLAWRRPPREARP